jgi:hypothetical protein
MASIIENLTTDRLRNLVTHAVEEIDVFTRLNHIPQIQERRVSLLRAALSASQTLRRETKGRAVLDELRDQANQDTITGDPRQRRRGTLLHRILDYPLTPNAGR